MISELDPQVVMEPLQCPTLGVHPKLHDPENALDSQFFKLKGPRTTPGVWKVRRTERRLLPCRDAYDHEKLSEGIESRRMLSGFTMDVRSGFRPGGGRLQSFEQGGQGPVRSVPPAGRPFQVQGLGGVTTFGGYGWSASLRPCVSTCKYI